MLGEEQIDINGNVTADAISITVPNDFTSGKLLMKIQDVDVDIEGPELVIMPEDGDITQYVLKNSVQPFKGYGFEGKEWDRDGLHDWKKTNIKNGGGLQYPNNVTGTGRDPKGCIALHQWGQTQNYNGKMWQETSLPKGKYRVNLGGISLGRDKGSVKAVFVVCRGTKVEDIPEYDNGTWREKQKGVEGEIVMEIGHSEDDNIVLDLVENMNDLIVSFVVWANSTAWASFTSVTVHLVE